MTEEITKFDKHSDVVTKEQFLDVFNDVETYPTVSSVAEKLNMKSAKVSQVANRYRQQGEVVINRRKKDNPFSNAGPTVTEDDTSSITFYIDSDLNVSVSTEVNLEEIVDVLVDNEYIAPAQREDEFACHLAFILLANEVTQQILSQYTE